MKKGFLLAFIISVLISNANGQMYLKVKVAPQFYTAFFDTLHVPSALNNWDPSFNYEMISENLFKIPAFQGNTEYKITRGNWNTVEAAINGNDIANRTITYQKDDTIVIEVKQWKDLYTSSAHTASPQIHLLKSDFKMPQLSSTRRVWIYLPADYYTSGDDYPVLYMHDGQNLFDKPYSFVGEWKVDEALDQFESSGERSCIVIGIDNGGGERINEYTPYRHPTYGGGQGEAYTAFLVETLKPFIDSHFRTLPGPKNTGIAGSSLGGLISYYAAIKHPEIFGKVGVFSPSFWYSDSLFADVASYQPLDYQKFYIMAGQNEDADMVPDIDNYIDKMKIIGINDEQLLRLIQPDGQHSEWFWAREFPAAYKWLDLWDKELVKTKESIDTQIFMSINESPSLYPRIIISSNLTTPAKVVILDEKGNQFQTFLPTNHTTISMDSTAKAGVYFAHFSSGKHKQTIKFIKM